MCSRPRVHQIEFYSKNGKSLGDYVFYTLSRVLEKCENGCDRKGLDHKHYFFKGTSAVTIACTISEEPLKTLQAYRECKVCACRSQAKKLNDLAWKFSFNKFIDNFFAEGSVETETCGHDFYKDGRFYFGLSSYLVMIGIDSFQQFSVKRVKKYDGSILRNLLDDLVVKVREFAVFLVDDFLVKWKEELFERSLSDFSEENKAEDGVVLNESIRMVEESYLSAREIMMQVFKADPKDYLEAEMLRRVMFQHIAGLVVDLEACLELLESLEKRKGSEISLLSDLSSPVIVSNDLKHLNISHSDKLDVLNRPEFNFFKSSNSTFPTFSDDFCIPFDEDDTLTAISLALTSEDYQERLKEDLDDSEDFKEKVETELLGGKEDHFKFKHTNYKQDSFASSVEYENFRKVYGDSISVKVVAYFFKQFHGIRSFALDSHYDFLLSISQAQKEELHLGKSKAYFRNSVDERFIIKVIGERQFRMFTDFAPNYFRHVYKREFHKMPSCLVKILGAYLVKIKNKSTGKVRKEFVLINENLAYGFPEKSLVFDLKGTVNKRRKVLDGDERTKMDLNFVEFMKGLPVILGVEDKKRLDAEIWNDTLFLSQQNIVDYSLLLIFDVDGLVVDYGIIDYMEQYTFERAIESKYKTVVGTELPTIIYPKEYKNRFRQHLIQIYFMSVE
jgi:hypothetical protein